MSVPLHSLMRLHFGAVDVSASAVAAITKARRTPQRTHNTSVTPFARSQMAQVAVGLKGNLENFDCGGQKSYDDSLQLGVDDLDELGLERSSPYQKTVDVFLLSCI